MPLLVQPGPNLKLLPTYGLIASKANAMTSQKKEISVVTWKCALNVRYFTIPGLAELRS